MPPLHDNQALKTSISLSMNSDLLRWAREQGFNLSAMLEQALIQALRQHQQEQWRIESCAAIDVYNHEIEKYGSFGDAMRRF